MSSLCSISIQGFRSFGPKDQDRQLIKFYSPITLIVGLNGSGKTTIIECIRYVTTGEVPPGTGRGVSFVRDPKLTGDRETRAQVRLKLKPSASNAESSEAITIQRSVKVVQKASKCELTTLDGVITRINEASGQKVSVTSRCGELDVEVLGVLGVSKCVASNVIFCHQEETLWPLDESKKVKEKFDALFETTKYMKALDAIKKQRVGLSVKSKEFVIEVKYLKERKTEAAKMKEEREKAKHRIRADALKAAEIVDELRLIGEKLKDISRNCQGIQGMVSEREMLRGEMNVTMDCIKSLKVEDAEMKKLGMRELHEKEAALKEKSDESEALQILKDKIKEVGVEVTNKQDERERAIIEKGRMELDVENQAKKETQLVKMIGEGGSADAWMREMKEKIRKMQDDVKSEVGLKEGKLKALQKKMDAVKDELARLAEAIKIKKQNFEKESSQIHFMKEELIRLKRLELDEVDVSDKLNALNKKLSDCKSEIDPEAVKKEIIAMQKDKSSKENEVKTLNKELNIIHASSALSAEINTLLGEGENKVRKVAEIYEKSKSSVSLLLVCNDVEEKDCHFLCDLLKQNIQKLKSERKQSNKELRELNNERSKLEADVAHLEEEIKKEDHLAKNKKKEIESLLNFKDEENDIDIKDDGRALTHHLQMVKEDLNTLQEKKGALSGSHIVYTRFVSRLNEKKSCPLCNRCFADPKEIDSLSQDLTRRLNKIPDKVEEVEKTISSKLDLQRDLTIAIPKEQEIKKLCMNLPEKQASLCEKKARIEKIRKEVLSLSDAIETGESDEEIAKQAVTDLEYAEKLNAEISALKLKVKTLKESESEDTLSLRSVELVSGEKEELVIEIEGLAKKVEMRKQKLIGRSEGIAELMSRVNECEKQRLSMQKEMQKKERLEEELCQMKERIEYYSKESKEMTRSRSEKDGELLEIREVYDTMTLQLKKFQSQKNKETNDDMNLLKEVERLHIEIVKLSRGHQISSELEKLVEHISFIEQEMKTLKMEKKKLADKCDLIDRHTSNNMLKLRKVQDAIQYKKLSMDLESKKNEVEKINVKLKGIDTKNLEVQRQCLIKKEEELLKEKHQMEGRQSEVRKEISRIDVELLSSTFADINERYSQKVIELRTTDIVCKDLTKYYEALDRAIMTYHLTKIKEINKSIKYLWRKTYKGSDIDYIEIVSDEGGVLGGRKSHNYRVVMVKLDDNTRLDMRGRCSAGQKVIASIIIRLALADAFSLNCGIFALDEPTTNLDHENILSLASTLVELVEERRASRDFQLIVITHDEDFIAMLARSCIVEFFYKVEQNEFCLSTIKKCSFSDYGDSGSEK